MSRSRNPKGGLNNEKNPAGMIQPGPDLSLRVVIEIRKGLTIYAIKGKEHLARKKDKNYIPTKE